MSRKAELEKLKKQKTGEELETLFNQFDEQVHVFEEKISTIKKSIEVFEAKKLMNENILNEGEALAEDKNSPA
jgi:hypothetical protein